jgi:predicted secreted protein
LRSESAGVGFFTEPAVLPGPQATESWKSSQKKDIHSPAQIRLDNMGAFCPTIVALVNPSHYPMKASTIAFGCFLFGVAACTAPQGKKLTSTTGGLAPVAAGPPTATATITAPVNPTTTLTSAYSGGNVSLTRNGTVTVMLDASESDGYKWRLAEVPDPTVLKVVSQDFVPSTTPEGRGQEKWIFQATGPGDVDVKMWYGNIQANTTSNPTFDFVASVSEQMKQEKKSRKSKKSAAKVASAF